MYILIPLPYNGLLASGFLANKITNNLRKWAKEQAVNINIETTVREHIIVTFDCESLYTLFSLTWPSGESATNWTPNWNNMRIMPGPAPVKVVNKKGS